MSLKNDDPETTLIDYFVVVGYDSELGIVPVNTSYGDDEAYKFRPPLERSYTSNILQHFPQRRLNAPFSHEIVHLCMPRGLRFYTEKDVPHNACVHTFANIREDGSRVNGTALTFYEEVKDTAICDAMTRLQTEHVKELTAQDRGLDRAHLPPGTVSGGTHTLPRGRRSATKRISYYDGGMHNRLFVSKTLCVITRLPLVAAPSAILKTFYDIIKGEQETDLPLESYLYWILNELPLPSPGTTLKVSLLNTPLIVQRPGFHELPLFDDSMGTLFQVISVDKFLKLLTCFLLEHQIIICAKDFSLLMCVCESLNTLSFPFRWLMTYVPILPSVLFKMVESPMPFVMGWCYEDKAPEVFFQSNICVVDLNTNRTEFPEDLPTFPGAKELEQEIYKAIKRYTSWTDSPFEQFPSNSPKQDVSHPHVVPRQPTVNGRRMDDWSMKRMSRSFDLDDYDDNINGSPRPSRAGLKHLPLQDDLINNSTIARVAEIARRAGVAVDVSDIENEMCTNDKYANSPVCRQYFSNAKLNNAVRECVLHRLVCMFYSYEHFVVGGQGCSDKDDFEANRDSLVCFDKASFLSDQPDSHLAFLAAFLETQMFTSFIDAKILSQWENPDENLVLFDSKIAQMKDKLGLSMVRTPTYETSPPFAHSEELISKREDTIDYVVPGPHNIAGAFATSFDSTWPHLNSSLLEGITGISPGPSPWKKRYPRLRPMQQENSPLPSARLSSYGGQSIIVDSPSAIAQQQLKFVEQLLRETKGKTKRMLVDKMGKEAVQLGHLDAGITGVEENTLVASFCDLLERIWSHGLNKKQGKSALWTYVLQHEEYIEKSGMSTRTMSSSMLTPALRRTPSLSANHDIPAPIILPPSNENDLGAAISDIVDSIQRELNVKDDPEAPAWSKSILRAANFLCDKISSAAVATSTLPPREPTRESRPFGSSSTLIRRSSVGPRSMNPGMRKSCSVSDFTNPHWGSSGSYDGTSSVEGSPRKRSQSRARSPDGRVVLAPLPTSIAYDLKNVLRMTEIKTDIGYARAFVRLALERKLLHNHLTTLLGNQRLLREMYKAYAFPRCEDEKEQFLFHILSLNAAQFRCFTNTFTKTKMDYQVVIVTSGWRGSLPAVWVEIEGSLAKSPPIKLPPGTPLFKFDHKNLGLLSNLRIGHVAEVEKLPKWFLDYVIVRNEITGQTYRFPCGRWFGKGVDDGSLERLLIAEPVVEEEGTDSAACPPGSPARGRRRASSRSQTPQRERSPSNGRQPESSTSNKKSRLMDVQHMLGDSVNALVKYFHSEKKIKSELAHLLCGERGLVCALEQAFQYGRQESSWALRMFRQYYPWDYIEKVSMWFYELFRRGESEKLSREKRNLIMYALKLVKRISEKTALGKDGKFHVFVLLTIRDHVLSGFLQLMAWTPVTREMYEEPSFLRSTEHLLYLSKLLHSLNEFQFQLEPSLTYGIV